MYFQKYELETHVQEYSITVKFISKIEHFLLWTIFMRELRPCSSPLKWLKFAPKNWWREEKEQEDDKEEKEEEEEKQGQKTD